MGNSSSADDRPIAKNPDDVRQKYTVRLNVYKPLSTGEKGQDALAKTPGFGVHHSGVEVHEAEYVYGGGGTRSTGVYSQRPKWQPNDSTWEFKETVEIGETTYTKEQVQGIITEMKTEYPANSYDITSRNCNHFADDLCKRLTGKGIPGWVNRIAKVGNAVKSIVGDFTKPQEETQGTPVAPLNPVVEYADLLPEIDVQHVGCLNQSNDHPVSILFQKQSTGIFKKKELYLESDCDEQLLIFLSFKNNVKIHSLHICGPEGFAPKVVKLFVNNKDMDFDSAQVPFTIKFDLFMQSMNPTQAIELTPKHVEGEGEVFPLKFVSFQNVMNLVVFIESNQGKKDVTKVSKMTLIGIPQSSTNMQQLKAIQ